ncbi:hypothetical protein LCGC14_0842300 [marine sediment metagenome]|uniref:Uncharacterized protein n=1 Tax=marine sediment metagenome TaxID=412755 RepID=A0A0F9RXE8_9ZZZZ
MIDPGERCKRCAWWDEMIGSEDPLDGCVSYGASLELSGEASECPYYKEGEFVDGVDD